MLTQALRSSNVDPGCWAVACFSQRALSATWLSPPASTALATARWSRMLDPRIAAIRSQNAKSVSEGNAKGLSRARRLVAGGGPLIRSPFSGRKHQAPDRGIRKQPGAGFAHVQLAGLLKGGAAHGGQPLLCPTDRPGSSRPTETLRQA